MDFGGNEGGGGGNQSSLTEYKEMGLKKVDCQLTVSKGGRVGGHKNIKEPGGDWVDFIVTRPKSSQPSLPW